MYYKTTIFKFRYYVSDYLGNLVINQSLFEETGARMPLSISASYNSFYNDTNFEEGSLCGYGWQFSFNQYVREVSDANLKKNGYNYIYLDSEGTNHYLKLSEGKTDEWLDEDGFGLTLTKDENNIYIDNGSTKQTYESTAAGGRLLSEKDEHNNTITYNYSEGKLISITDGAGRTTSFTYGTTGNGKTRITGITKPDNSTITIAYGLTYVENDVISSITFSDGSKSEYSYDNYSRLTSAVSCKNSEQIGKHTFEYSNNFRVIKVNEYGKDNTEGNYLNINYGNDNTTVFTDRQGRSETHTFDNSGSTVSVLNANGYLENGGNSGLSISGGADSFTKNYITESTEQNAVGSGKYYYKTNGARNSITSSGGTVSIDNSEPTEENGQVQYFGKTSIKVNNPESSTNSAFFTGATHQIDSTEFNGKDITFSAYVKTKNITQIYSGGPIGATLKIKCYNSSGATLKDVNSIGISGTLDWQRLSITVKVPENTSRIRIYCNLRYASGTAWFDCLQLEEGNCANDFNALQNGNFESNEYWLTNENKAITAQNGTVTINGEAGAFNNAKYDDTETDTEIENEEPSTYFETVTETAPNDSINTYDNYGNLIKTEQGFVTRTVKNIYEVRTTEPSDSTDNDNSTDDSQTSSEENTDDFVEPYDNSFGNKYIYQTVNVGRSGVIFNISGEAQAKSVPLSNENRTYGIALNIYYEGSSIPETHYQEFNAATSQKQTTCMTVTPENAATKISYVAFAFVYGNNKNTMTANNAMLNISPAYVSESASDDFQSEDEIIDYEVISESVDTSKDYMVTSTSYDDNGNYAASETDEAGNTVTYTYDTSGNKTSVTDGEGNVVNYTYNLSNNVTSVNSNGSENQYSYNGTNDISAITHNGFSYNFNYDVFNNLISTKIGNTAIVSNTYSTNNGNLIKTTYANGDYIEYTYDEHDNITKLTSETGIIAEFIYNKKGLVAKAVDNSSATTTYYYYDFSGNLTGEYRQTSGGDLSYFLSYDSEGNKVEKTSINGQTKTITTGTDEDGKAFVSNDGVTAKTVTDDFGRTTEVKTSRGEGNSVFFTNYEYAGGKSENSTTNLVSKLTQKYGSDELVNYEYIYDKNGNITEIKQNGKVSNKYTYDSLNQLIKEYDYVNRFFIIYSYDGAGNIQAKNEQYLDPTYDYPVGKPQGNVYYYNDTEWKDKLTKINNDDITYDESGNPLSYRDGMSFTWQNGRQLASLQTEDNSVTYKYDSNGMRTQKTDNNGTTYYYYDSNKNLIGLTKGNDTLLFYYDSDANVTSFKYNGTMYYYIKNLQGDIVKIIDQAGTEVAGYVYDAWGTIHSQTGDPNIRRLNPFRYRGYVYDEETGFYYLQSRYYDPFTGRFLNADVLFDTQSGTPLSTNMFAYCENNSINSIDRDGHKTTISPAKPYKYYRNNAVNYARKWCYGRNSLYYSYSQDCTNFVSQCLFEGGIPMTFNIKSGSWHSVRYKNGKSYSKYSWDVTPAWRLCNDNYKYIKNSKYAKKVVTIKDNKNSVKTASKNLKIGDPIYFDDNACGKPYHAAIITKISNKKIYYTAHSISNKDKDLEKYLTHKSKSKKTVYAIAIKDRL